MRVTSWAGMHMQANYAGAHNAEKNPDEPPYQYIKCWPAPAGANSPTLQPRFHGNHRSLSVLGSEAEWLIFPYFNYSLTWKCERKCRAEGQEGLNFMDERRRRRRSGILVFSFLFLSKFESGKKRKGRLNECVCECDRQRHCIWRIKRRKSANFFFSDDFFEHGPYCSGPMGADWSKKEIVITIKIESLKFY